MEKITRKDLNDSPDETRSFDKGRVDVGKLDEYIIGKPQFEAWVELGEIRQTHSNVRHHILDT